MFAPATVRGSYRIGERLVLAQDAGELGALLDPFEALGLGPQFDQDLAGGGFFVDRQRCGGHAPGG